MKFRRKFWRAMHKVVGRSCGAILTGPGMSRSSVSSFGGCVCVWGRLDGKNEATETMGWWLNSGNAKRETIGLGNIYTRQSQNITPLPPPLDTKLTALVLNTLPQCTPLSHCLSGAYMAIQGVLENTKPKRLLS